MPMFDKFMVETKLNISIIKLKHVITWKSTQKKDMLDNSFGKLSRPKLQCFSQSRDEEEMSF